VKELDPDEPLSVKSVAIANFAMEFFSNRRYETPYHGEDRPGRPPRVCDITQLRAGSHGATLSLGSFDSLGRVGQWLLLRLGSVGPGSSEAADIACDSAGIAQHATCYSANDSARGTTSRANGSAALGACCTCTKHSYCACFTSNKANSSCDSASSDATGGDYACLASDNEPKRKACQLHSTG
jgi:hypothetical protein